MIIIIVIKLIKLFKLLIFFKLDSQSNPMNQLHQMEKDIYNFHKGLRSQADTLEGEDKEKFTLINEYMQNNNHTLDVTRSMWNYLGLNNQQQQKTNDI